MTRNLILAFAVLFLSLLGGSAYAQRSKQNQAPPKVQPQLKVVALQPSDSVRDRTVNVDAAAIDTITTLIFKFKSFKKNVHASYYADKFNGRRMASGVRFDNKRYTAAHRKLPFGTRLRVTNQANGKSVVVEITDRGPFSRGREIDITRKAFMEITDNKNSGSMTVNIEIEDEK